MEKIEGVFQLMGRETASLQGHQFLEQGQLGGLGDIRKRAIGTRVLLGTGPLRVTQDTLPLSDNMALDNPHEQHDMWHLTLADRDRMGGGVSH